jgi:peroxiredoxin
MFRFASRRLGAAAAATPAAEAAAAATPAPSPLKAGDVIPDSQVFVGTPPRAVSTATALFKNKKVMLVAVPGAFTGTCNKQLAEYVKEVAALKKAHDITELLCVSTNDTFVNAAWASASGLTDDSVTMVADPCHSLLENLGHIIDLPVLGGDRFARVTMVIEDSKIAQLWAEKDGKSLTCTKADNVLSGSQSKPSA